MGWFSGPSEFEKRLQVIADQLESTNQWTEEMIAEFNACMPKINQETSPAMSKLNALMEKSSQRQTKVIISNGADGTPVCTAILNKKSDKIGEQILTTMLL